MKQVSRNGNGKHANDDDGDVAAKKIPVTAPAMHAVAQNILRRSRAAVVLYKGEYEVSGAARTTTDRMAVIGDNSKATANTAAPQ